jgi:predicted methyltransferase
MKLPDMLLQAEVISRWFHGKDVVFIGDGDAIGLTVAHLSKQELLPGSPKHILVLDFDERIVNSINNFANKYGLTDSIAAELYNVCDPLPRKHWQNKSAFYTNPPWGSSNKGKSVQVFVDRGVEALESDALGCVVIGDHPDYLWTHEVLRIVQNKILEKGFRITEMLPNFHRYHLDDNPELTSCCIIFDRENFPIRSYDSKSISNEDLKDFYGCDVPLRIHYIRDKTNGGKLESNDYEAEPFLTEGASQ